MIESPYLVEPGKSIKLDKLSTDDTGDFENKSDAKAVTDKTLSKLDDLQEVLYAGAEQALLIVLQAMDAGGKDGTIRSIFSGVNPQGCSVTSFKAPSKTELAHDYLWRIHAACPARGMIGIFNRSHYESVAVERIQMIAPKDVWSKRFDQINDFEKMLADEGTTIVKLFLYIDRDEQRERLQARLDEPDKRWKFSKGDLDERDLWPEYITAFEEVLRRTSTDRAPWYLIPANRKWFRNLAVAHILGEVLDDLDPHYPRPDEDLEGIVIPS